MPAEKNMSTSLTCFKFSHDFKSLLVGTKNEAKVFRLDDFKRIFRTKMKDVLIVEQLCKTNIICIVTEVYPKRIEMFLINQDKYLWGKMQRDNVLDIRSNEFFMITGYQNKICVHDSRDFIITHTLEMDSKNALNLLALSQAYGGNSYLAYTLSDAVGEIAIFEVAKKRKIAEFRAHNSAVVYMTFNPNEQILATASEKGTVIRLISIPSGTKLCEFRRGLQRNADIYYLSFSIESNFLVCSGSTGTIHVFKYSLPWQEPENNCWSQYVVTALKTSVDMMLGSSKELAITSDSETKEGWLSYARGVITSTATFIPKQFYEVCSQTRSFLKIKQPRENEFNNSILVKINGTLCVAVVTSDGSLSLHDVEREDKSFIISAHCLLES